MEKKEKKNLLLRLERSEGEQRWQNSYFGVNYPFTLLPDHFLKYIIYDVNILISDNVQNVFNVITSVQQTINRLLVKMSLSRCRFSICQGFSENFNMDLGLPERDVLKH